MISIELLTLPLCRVSVQNMTEIATYKCPNIMCGLIFRLSRNFPVWHAHTPKELRKLPVSSSVRAYVARYRSESFCTRCRKVVEHTETNTCSLCDAEVHREHMGRACPQCRKGKLFMPWLSVYGKPNPSGFSFAQTPTPPLPY